MVQNGALNPRRMTAAKNRRKIDLSVFVSQA